MSKPWFDLTVIVGIVFATASPVIGQTATIGEVDIPSQRQWCLARSMSSADLKDPAKQRQHLTSVMRAIAIEAANTSKPLIGMPHVATVMAGITAGDPVTVTFCSNVTAGDVPIGVSNIQAIDRGAARVVALSCGAIDFDNCDQRLTDALMADPWNFTEGEVAAMSARIGETASIGTLNDQAVAAINNAGVLLYDRASDTVITLPVFGERTTIIAYQLP